MKYKITEKHSNSKSKFLSRSLLVFVIGVLAFLFLGNSAWKAYLEKRRSEQVLSAANTELTELNNRYEFVTNELEQLSTQEGREAKLREKFGVARPGEQVAIIVQSDNNDASSTESVNIWNEIKLFFSSLFQK